MVHPWSNTTAQPATRFIATRNPYHHRIDASGQQLPYAERFIFDVVGGALVPAKTAAGEADLQARGLNFSDYTFLKAAEERSGYHVRLWKTVRSEERSVGKECVSTCRSLWSPYNTKKKLMSNTIHNTQNYQYRNNNKT